MTTPPISQIRDNIVAQIEGELSTTIPLLPVGFTRVLATAMAAVFVLLYKYAGFTLLQLFVQHATYEPTTINGKTFRPLQMWGDLYGVTPRHAAARAEHTISVRVTTQSGTLPAGAQLVNPVNGYIHQVLSAVTLSSSTVNATILAVSDPSGGGGSGAGGNLTAGDVLQFVSPIKNVARDATVVSLDTQGTDAESVSSYRKRVLDKRRKPPQGGAHADYYHWAMEVPGIVDALPYNSAPGQVTVYVEATEASSGSADGIPSSSQLEAVAESIQFTTGGLAARRPVGAGVTVTAITRKTFDLVVAGLDVNDEAAVQASITTGVDEYLRSLSPYIVGLSVPPRADKMTQPGVAGVVFDIVNAANGSLSSVTINDSGSPVTVYNLQDGEKAKLGTTSWPSS